MSLAELLNVIDAGGAVALAVVVAFGLWKGFGRISQGIEDMRTDMREDRREFVEAVRANGEALARIDERTIAIVKQTRPMRPPTVPPYGSGGGAPPNGATQP